MIIELSIATAAVLGGIGTLLLKPEQEAPVSLLAKPQAKPGAFNFPLDLLSAPNGKDSKKAEADASKILPAINAVLTAQRIDARAISVTTGPTTWTVELECPPSLKLQEITSRLSDIAFRIGYPNIRTLGARQGVTTLGLEITRDSQTLVTLREILDSKAYRKAKGGLIVPLGVESATGDVLLIDLAKMPHMLLTGTTGSGKSVLLNVIIASFMYRYSTKEIRFVLIDPKVVELKPYEGLDHVDGAIVTDMAEAEARLAELVAEMDRRYAYLSRHGVKNIDQLTGAKKLHRIICVVEEYADAYGSKNGQKIAEYTQKLAQKSRACGIHMVLVTQRPTVSCLPSETKVNLAARVTGQLLNQASSRVVLDQNGAELLFGNGDMYLLLNGKLIRFQSPFIDEDTELPAIIDFLKHGKKKTVGVKTGFLSMSLDEETGELSGVVRKGDQKGRKLLELSRLELWRLQAEVFPCPESRLMLDSFMDSNGVEQPDDGEKNRLLFSLEYGFTRAELKKARGRMMKKYHPDKSGSNELAAELNIAYEGLKNA